MLLLFPLWDSIMRFNLHGISVQFRIYMASFHIHLALFAHVWTCALPVTGVVIQVSSSHQEGESCLLQVREIQLSMGGSWEVPRNNSFTVVAEAEACSDQSCVVKAHKDRDLPGSSWYRKDRQDPQSLQQFHREQLLRFAWTWSTPVRIPVLAAGEELLPNVHYDSNRFAIGLSPWHDLCISSSISCQFQVGRCFLWECCGDCKCFGLGYCARAESAFIRCSFHRTSEIASEWVMENRWSKKGERLKMELPVSYSSHRRGFLSFYCWVNCAYHTLPNEPVLHPFAEHFLLEDGVNYSACIYPARGACLAPIYISSAQCSPRLAALCSACSEGLLHCKSNDSRETHRQMKFSGFNISWQPWPYPLNSGWHLDALFSSQTPADV